MPPCKILIIDDDQDDIEILSEAFTSSGVEAVHYVHSAMQAFMYLEDVMETASLPHLIVTDMYLPGITGAQFLEDLKEMNRYKHIHIIVLYTVTNEQEMERYRLMGVEDYLVKPSRYPEYQKVAEYIKSKANL